jgi:chloramphenicol-sensitive protein RarD
MLAFVAELIATMDERRGLLYGLAAYSLWGLFPLYWPLLEPAGAGEILAHRCLWSLIVVLGVLAYRRRLRSLRRILSDRRTGPLLTFAAVLIAVNWGTYIYGVNTERVVETALGYFITPLVTVLLGVVVLGERLSRTQGVAVILAGVAVLVLAIGYGHPPYIALVLAASFSTYGLLKKKAGVGALESLGAETAVLAVPAALFVVTLGSSATFSDSGGHALLLAGGGIVTAIPLLFFGAAATRIPLTTLGLLQYLTPTVQFLIGVLLRHEPLPPERLVGFVLVWLALAVFTVGSFTERRRSVAVATVTEPVG